MKTIKLLAKTLVALAVAFFIGSFVATAAGFAEYAVLAGTVSMGVALLPTGMNLQSQLNTITITDILTEWGALYRPQGQGIKDILTKLMQRSVTASYFPTRITEATIMEKAVAEFTRVLQRFQKGWTPIGGTTFTPEKIPLYKLKIDLQETPDDLEESWLGFLADKNLDRRKWPFIKWFLMRALEQAEQDLELNEIYSGVPGTITAGTATAAGASLLGIKAQINAADTAGTGSKIILGAVPDNPTTDEPKDFVDYVEQFVAGIPRLVRNETDHIFMNEDLRDLFRDGMRQKYNTNYEQVGDSNITKMRNDNITIVGLPSMVGSDKLWASPEWNRQGGFKKPTNERIFEVEKVDRTVKAYTDYYRGYGFWIKEYLYYNDVELT